MTITVRDPETTSFPVTPELLMLIADVCFAGGRPIIVGGAVRDWLLGLEPKDVDVEVYGLTYAALETALTPHFKCDAVGKSFGILKATPLDDAGNPISGSTFDVSLPRSESKAGTGHRGFVAVTDPNMSFTDAAARRDFTINSMGWDMSPGDVEEFGAPRSRLLDPHNGLADLKAGILRHVGPAFSEDPLRVLRAAQFAARFDFFIAIETISLCRHLKPELSTLAVERLWEEWKKLLVKGKKPSAGLMALVETEAIDLFPELKALIGVPQDPEWHPEGASHPLGSLWIHNCMVTDAAVQVCNDDALDDEERLIVMVAALCHDLGKPATTEFKDGRWRAHDHESQGEAPTRSFLTRIGAPPAVIDAVVPVVQHHLKPFHLFRDQASGSAIRRLANKVPLMRLCRVARADHMGRTTPDALAVTDSRQIEGIMWLLERTEALRIDATRPPDQLLKGRHLLTMGWKPGKEMGVALKRAFEAQLEGVFDDEAGAIEWAQTNATLVV